MQALLASLLAFGALGVLAGLPERFIAGTDYEVLATPVTTGDAARIEVVEAFSYGCPHCYSFDPLIDAWRGQLAADVAFQRMPVVWNTQFKLLAQGYFTAVSLDLVEKTHTALFRALHVDGKSLSSAELLAGFYAGHGVSASDFLQVFSSFGVRAQVQQASARTQAYGVTGVPTMIVNGKYKIDTGMAGSPQAMLQVAAFLIDKERAARGSTAAATKPAAGG